MARRPFRLQLSELLHSLDPATSPATSPSSGGASPTNASSVGAELTALGDLAKTNLRATFKPAAGLRVLSEMLAENAQFAKGAPKSHATPAQRARLAAVIACADAQACPEAIFRAALGDLFVIRTLGNTAAGDETNASLEYAVGHLRVSLVLVLGHTRCGTVAAAAAAGGGGGAPAEGALGRQVAAIAAGVEAFGGLTGDVDIAVRRNVKAVVAFLRKNPAGCVATAEKRRRLVVRAAVYDVATGVVTVLGEDGEDGLAAQGGRAEKWEMAS